MHVVMTETATATTETAEVTPEAETAQSEAKETDWQAEARKWESRAKANKKALDEAAPKLNEYESLKNASQTDLERAQGEASRWQQDSERWRVAALASRVQALAGEFADPTDAVTALADTSKYLTAGGEIDDAAIQNDLAEVLERKPHWRRAETTGPRPPAPNRAQGTAGSAAGSDDPAQQFAAFLKGQLRS